MQTSPRRLLTLIVVACAPAVAAAQTPIGAYRGRVMGVFTMDGDPIEGAEVVDEASKTSALTTKTGTVSLSFLAEGATLVRVRKLGFVAATMLVNISPEDTLPVTVMLKPGAQQLEKVVTTDSVSGAMSPGLRAFDERRAKGGGYFISGKELRKWDAGPLTNAVRTIPGIDVVCIRTPGPRTGECYASNKRTTGRLAMSGSDCPVDIYLDGAVYFQAVGARAQFGNDLQRLQATQFAGVEYYSGAARIPAEFNKTGAVCGVLLLWTRER
jgi:hypothetical protein